MLQAENSNLEYRLVGGGKNNVIFFNGFRMPFNSWDKVYPEIAENNHVLLFNRLGVGASARATEPQTGRVVINQLKTLLSQLEFKPPYLLVGHSLGGIFANLYARIFENEVVGVVFVDAPHPSEIAEQKVNEPPLILRVLNGGAKYVEKIFNKYKYSEDEVIGETTLQIQQAGNFPDVPVAIVSGGKKLPFVPTEAFKIHQNYQLKLLELSEQSKHYLCENSGHFPQITEPNRVIYAINETLNKIPKANKSIQPTTIMSAE